MPTVVDGSYSSLHSKRRTRCFRQRSTKSSVLPMAWPLITGGEELDNSPQRHRHEVRARGARGRREGCDREDKRVREERPWQLRDKSGHLKRETATVPSRNSMSSVNVDGSSSSEEESKKKGKEECNKHQEEEKDDLDNSASTGGPWATISSSRSASCLSWVFVFNFTNGECMNESKRTVCDSCCFLLLGVT